MSIAEIKPPLSERAAIHGRNVMAISCLALALAWVPGINLEDLTLFGLNFENEPVAQTSAWVMMATVLCYYCWRFRIDYTTDFETWNELVESEFRRIRQTIGNRSEETATLEHFTQKLIRNFWRYDVYLPLGLFGAAFTSILIKLALLHQLPQRFLPA